tara:strand:+ start:252 stop:494 length:243 start_codon:yes stop_codon:yes gene_type:complete
MDWKNVNLESSYERDQSIIDALSFDTLLLEISCNVREINAKTVMQQFEEDLQSRIQSAREVMRDNLKNIVNDAKKYQDEN